MLRIQVQIQWKVIGVKTVDGQVVHAVVALLSLDSRCNGLPNGNSGLVAMECDSKWIPRGMASLS
jgi:hypothetical protein